MPYMVTFTINIPPMLVYIPYMDPMGYGNSPGFATQQQVPSFQGFSVAVPFRFLGLG